MPLGFIYVGAEEGSNASLVALQINVADRLEFSGDTLGTKPSVPRIEVSPEWRMGTGLLQCDYQNRHHLDKVDQSDNRKNNNIGQLCLSGPSYSTIVTL